jgi:flagellar biosynthesis protein
VKLKRVVALQYEQQKDLAPRVVAKGAGEVAEAILRLARQADVSVHQDEELVNALMKLELGAVIPEELYAVVAEVLAVVYQKRNPS